MIHETEADAKSDVITAGANDSNGTQITLLMHHIKYSFWKFYLSFYPRFALLNITWIYK